MRKTLFAIAAGILLIMGINASDSFSSDVSNFFTGKPTDQSIWLTVGGAAALVAGVVTTAMATRKTARG